MSEILKPSDRQERRERIKDIRERKGHLLGRGLVASGSDPGYVPAIPVIDGMKYSVPVRDVYGDVRYEDRGIPANSVRRIASSESEFVKPVNGHKPEHCGRMALNGAVNRQQHMLAERLLEEQQAAQSAREQRLGHYIELLCDPIQLADQETAEQFDGYVREFYLPRNADEEGRIIDAGGITYGF